MGIPFKYLEWDKGKLGIDCGLIDLRYFKNDFDEISIHNLINTHKEIKFITLKIPQKKIDILNSLLKFNNFRLIDTEITFKYTRCDYENLIYPKNIKLEYHDKYESAAFISLAEDMIHSRFFVEKNISYQKALNLWQTSIHDHCSGYSDKMLIALFNDQPAGIITLRFNNEKELYLHIVGVIKKYRGHGIAKYMINRIINDFCEGYNIMIETQSNNIPAQKIYQKAGLNYSELNYIIHYWKNDSSY
jgi:ribosomal protein S18 acetylase RimI-like enzyme